MEIYSFSLKKKHSRNVQSIIYVKEIFNEFHVRNFLYLNVEEIW